MTDNLNIKHNHAGIL